MTRHRSNHPGSKSGGFADWLGAALHCVVSSNPTWSSQLHRSEYAHNLLISTANGLSPFEVSLCYQPPLFLASGGDLAVSSIQHHLRCCHHVWKQNKPHSSEQLTRTAIWRTHGGPRSRSAFRVRMLGSPPKSLIKPSPVRLNLPASMRIYPTFSISQIIPVTSVLAALFLANP